MVVEASPAHRPLPAPEHLHPALWRAAQLGRVTTPGLATGFAALDAQLPGGGWPRQALTELLLPHPGVGEWRLLAPVLAALQHGQGGDLPRAVMLFDPPARPCPWTLAALGLDVTQLVVVQGRAPTSLDSLWALEQALASGQLGAVLAWLPVRLRGVGSADPLRRLQLAAQAHPGPVFLFRELGARLKPSAAPLRLQLAAGLPDQLRLRLFKRRGPPCAQPLVLALPPVLCATAHARALLPRGLPQPHAVAVPA
ncbi:MAG: translesion DNA synthesis-associated protein ImuA [Rubrivivax sp.]|nr:translesion DNA synthesis-associated protein ImuA [Rubrivivax sp.]